MKPGIKASLLIGSIVIAMFAVVYATTQFIILKGFTDLEADTVKLTRGA